MRLELAGYHVDIVFGGNGEYGSLSIFGILNFNPRWMDQGSSTEKIIDRTCGLHSNLLKQTVSVCA